MPLIIKAVLCSSFVYVSKPYRPVAVVKHKKSQADLLIIKFSEYPVFGCRCGLGALGQAYGRLRGWRHHCQLRALLQVVWNSVLADLRWVLRI